MGFSIHNPAIREAAKRGLIVGQAGVALDRKVSESAFTTEVIELAQSLGWLAVHFRSIRVGRKDGSTYWQCPIQGDAGFPDVVLLRGDRCVVAELKVKGGTTTPEQDTWLAGFKAAGVPAFVWRETDLDAIREVLS